MKRVSDRGKAVDLIPVVLNPVKIQVALGTVPAEVRDVAVAVRVLPHGTNVQNIIYTTIL